VRTRSAFLFLLLSLPACEPDQVTLSYGTQPGRRLAYRLSLNADIDRTLSGETRRQTVEASFVAEQTILSGGVGGTARARMVLRPRALVVDGRPQEVGIPEPFDVALGKDGRIVRIERGDREAQGDDESLAPLGLDRLLPRLRPVLPGRPVGPGDRWRSISTFNDEAGTFTLSLRSRLDRLGRIADRDAALVRTTYESPVRRREIFANAVTDIDGEDVGAQAAWFALDGFLVRATSDSVGTYRVVFRPPGERTGVAPVEGALTVQLHTEVELMSTDEG